MSSPLFVQKVVDGEKPRSTDQELGRRKRPEGKAFAVLSLMGERNGVLGRIEADGMDAWDASHAVRRNRERGGGGARPLPCQLPPRVGIFALEEGLCEGYRRAAWGIEFGGVVGLVDSDGILRKATAELCQESGGTQGDIDPDAKVRCIEERGGGVLLQQLRKTREVVIPTGGATDDGEASLDTGGEVVGGGGWGGKLYSDVGEVWVLGEVVGEAHVLVYARHDLMTVLQGETFDDVPHLAIADEGDAQGRGSGRILVHTA